MSGECTVLLADDDEDLRVSLREVLEQDGYAVSEARDGNELMERLRGTPPPVVVVVDLWMKNANGYQVIEELRANGLEQAVPLLVISGDGAFFGTAYPDVPFMAKPFGLLSFRLAVQRLASRAVGMTEKASRLLAAYRRRTPRV